jgi:putative transposase
MVTTETWGRRDLSRNERGARLLIDTLCHYRGSAYLLHEFVIMPHHLHILLTSLTSVKKAVQFLKGGFSYRAKKELGSQLHVIHIRQNPVNAHLCQRDEDYVYSSHGAGLEWEGEPQGLKPSISESNDGAPEGAPLQSSSSPRVRDSIASRGDGRGGPSQVKPVPNTSNKIA